MLGVPRQANDEMSISLIRGFDVSLLLIFSAISSVDILVIFRVYNKPGCDFRSSLMKTLDWSVEALGRECNSTGLCNSF